MPVPFRSTFLRRCLPGWLGLLLLPSPTARCAPPPAKVQLTFHVAVPDRTPKDAIVYLAGNCNGWKPADSQWRLRRQADGTWSGMFTFEPGYALQFKFTRGSWETVEKDAQGRELPNRIVEIATSGEMRLQVQGWRDQTPDPAVAPTVTGELRLVEAFPLPQLGTTRTLRILLPPGYDASDRRYPVLYMHDGQNLFDGATAFAGEWEVDESLARLTAGGQLPPMIVVGVDHGGKTRLSEYSPFRDDRIPEPRGDAYADFLVQTLKPWVDRTYRTHPDAAHTALAGSSLGGLISLHTALRHPGVFGKVACFSSSFWVGGRQMLVEIETANVDPGLRLYLDIGDREAGAPADSRQAVQDTEAVAAALRRRGLSGDRLQVVVAPGARHQEAAWAARFPAALTWLFQPGP